MVDGVSIDDQNTGKAAIRDIREEDEACSITCVPEVDYCSH